MIPYRLLTADGHLVTEGEMPPFTARADVIVWGSRVFEFECERKDDGTLEYGEAFAWWAPPTPNVQNRKEKGCAQ
jgi:hypothetical protein